MGCIRESQFAVRESRCKLFFVCRPLMVFAKGNLRYIIFVIDTLYKRS